MKFPFPVGVDSPLGRRLVALSFVRLAVLGFFLLVIEGYYLPELSGFSTQVAVATATLAFLSTAVFALPLRRESWQQPVAHAQLVVDQLTWTAIVYISGGVTSGSTSLYGLTSVSGAILLGTSGAISASASGAVFYLALCYGFATGTLAPPSDQSPAAYLVNSSDMVYPAFSTVLATLVVALLAAYLAERLRVFGGRLEDANRRALEAERLAALGRLAAGLAHEIRNPLGSIRGSIELLRTGSSLADEDRQLCRIIEQETARLNQLVTDMVDLSRPRAPEPSELDLAALAVDVVELSRSSGLGENLAVRYEGADTLTIVADCDQMRQLLWNLVRNALQASPPDGTVHVSLEPCSDGSVELTVRDHGSGIDETSRERVFEAFFTTRRHGVGIGLAVVKQIVDGHGFHIEVSNAADGGAAFSIRIPREHVVQPPAPATANGMRASAVALLALVGLFSSGCGGGDWVRPAASPVEVVPSEEGWVAPPTASSATPNASPVAAPPTPGEAPTPLTVTIGSGGARPSEVYRNTYYFFPEEPTHPESGPIRTLFDSKCRSLRTVSQDFHDKLCVQGSGKLATGETVSFAKRGCECATECPRTGHRICYELLEAAAFPWGRGATGQAITPLRTIAVDPEQIPLGTAVYIPEMNGLRDLEGKAHDGCFLAQDRGSKVKGRHLDFFVGTAATGEAWNRAVPSNRGVHVVVGASQCEWLAARAPKAKPTRRKKR